MKRLLGLLLALSLLFSFALGEESTRWTVSCSADASTAAQALTADCWTASWASAG